jgi:hypothetical protein
MNTERKNTDGRDYNDRDKDNSTSEPDHKTLHKTDPQDNMEGPVSSLMHDAGEQFDTEETKQKADAEKEKGM